MARSRHSAFDRDIASFVATGNSGAKKGGGQRCPPVRDLVLQIPRYLLGASVVGGLPERFRSVPVGAEDGGVCGRAGAAPVVTPGAVLVRGVTSRMPGGAAGGDAGVFCAVEDVGAVPAWLIVELFRP